MTASHRLRARLPIAAGVVALAFAPWLPPFHVTLLDNIGLGALVTFGSA